MANVFEMIHQLTKNNYSTYGDLLDNKFNPENDLSTKEKEMYNQFKGGDIKRFKISENKNLINTQQIQSHPEEISGIGKVIQIC